MLGYYFQLAIRNLRRKLSAEPGADDQIETVFGTGYRIRAERSR